MFNLLRILTRNLIIVIPISMLAGLLFGVVSDPRTLKVLIPAFTFLMVFPMMVTMQYKKAFMKCSLVAQGTTQFINFAIIPLIGYGLGKVFFPDRPYLALGLLLAALIPTSGMAVSWTSFARGNMELVVKIMVFGLAIGSIITPFYIKFLLGAQVQFQILDVLNSVLLVVFLPMMVGFIVRQFFLIRFGQEVFRDRIGPLFPPFSTLGVIGMVFTAIALKARVIVGQPMLLLEIMVPVILFYMAILALGVATGRMFLPRAEAIALLYGTTIRNLSISMAIAVNSFGKAGSEAALLLAAAFIVQAQVASWSARFIDRIFSQIHHESCECGSCPTG